MYEFGIFGSLSQSERATLIRTIEGMVDEFDLVLGKDVVLHDAASVVNRDKRSAFATVYFGGPRRSEEAIVRKIADENTPIIPTIGTTGNVAIDIPSFLQSLNVFQREKDDPNMVGLASALLECVGLLRPQRRLFLSYHRAESRVAASQLHDLLTARGFDVFLDTHDVRPGDPFQDILWHRLCDADAMVMLDTPTYFERKWTQQEFGRAMAKEIHVLRVVWPNHQPSKITDLAETIYLASGELETTEGPIAIRKANEIVLAIESLRARSIAARYRSISGKLKADVSKIGATVEGIGLHREILLRLSDDRGVSAYPVAGIPTAELLNDVENKARQAGREDKPILVYDHVGIGDAWNAHLRWLDDRIKTVRAIKVAEAAWSLAAWEG